MRDCVLPFVAALAPLAVAAPTQVPASVSDQSSPVFTAAHAISNAVTQDAAADLLDRAVDAPRSLAFWTTLDLAMLAVRDRVEASPLLREGLRDAAPFDAEPAPLSLALIN